MWLFGQMQPNIGDRRRLVQASWHASLWKKPKKTFKNISLILKNIQA